MSSKKTIVDLKLKHLLQEIARERRFSFHSNVRNNSDLVSIQQTVFENSSESSCESDSDYTAEEVCIKVKYIPSRKRKRKQMTNRDPLPVFQSAANRIQPPSTCIETESDSDSPYIPSLSSPLPFTNRHEELDTMSISSRNGNNVSRRTVSNNEPQVVSSGDEWDLSSAKTSNRFKSQPTFDFYCSDSDEFYNNVCKKSCCNSEMVGYSDSESDYCLSTPTRTPPTPDYDTESDSSDIMEVPVPPKPVPVVYDIPSEAEDAIESEKEKKKPPNVKMEASMPENNPSKKSRPSSSNDILPILPSELNNNHVVAANSLLQNVSTRQIPRSTNQERANQLNTTSVEAIKTMFPIATKDQMMVLEKNLDDIKFRKEVERHLLDMIYGYFYHVRQAVYELIKKSIDESLARTYNMKQKTSKKDAFEDLTFCQCIIEVIMKKFPEVPRHEIRVRIARRLASISARFVKN